ncbi:MAG TPA: polysaccharide deacetylase family protein [Desulfobacterales bacterium]|nr:polysaccharide deacetylase family protein [Desulfobacterales bacterium]
MRSSLTFACLCLLLVGAVAASHAETGVPILLYHRFGPVVADSMTVTTAVFESHLKTLRDSGVEIVTLDRALEMTFGEGVPPGRRCVALVADDAHVSVFTTALPLLKKYNAPMTLFVYPSAVSNASYAMTWDQLRQLKATGLFDFQSHTYWHPNFKKERERLPPAEFEKLVHMQLTKSREKLEKELEVKVELLAWPFGIYDPWLMAKASEAGYRAAFSIERRPLTAADARMALPRYLLADTDRGKAFESILSTALRSSTGRENRHETQR